MSHHQQRQLISKSQNQHESSISSSRNNSNDNNNNLITITSESTSSCSSSCHPSFGSKLGFFFSSSYQQQQRQLDFDWLQKQLASSAFPFCFNHGGSFNSKSRRWFGDLRQFMAGQADYSPAEIRKKKIGEQRKREELEREVSMLQNMLNQEEKVHEILEKVLNHNGSAITIPSYLPPKVKELVAELAMVEGEIGKLESQISQLKVGVKQEQEATKETKSKKWRYETPIRPPASRFSSHVTFASPLHNGAHSDRMAYETKTLHFISKAIKGDYNPNDFTLNERKGSLRGLFEQKENFSQEEKLQDKIFPKKSGMFKPASPMRDPRYASPKPARNPVMPSEPPPKSLSIPFLEENNQNWHPNKLSEEIMKCLNFIYIRLLRTTRAMELEKSGPISRSLHSSLSSRSFRVESGLNSKELKQQDPYGIFNVEESIPRDLGPYKNLTIFAASSMDQKSLSSPSSAPLLRKLRFLMNGLQTVDLKSLTSQQKLAFWINIYNACIMNGFLQYGVPSSPEKLLTLMNKAILNIGGNIINAQAIEHYILRKSPPSTVKEAYKKGERDEKEAMVRELYGLDVTDPNVTFALCCGTRSSPAVRMYTAESVIMELERSKLEYLQASIVVTSTKKIAFPELLLRNMLDFAADKESLVEWVCHQLPTAGSLRKSIVDCFRSHNNSRLFNTTVEKISYDFEFQYLLAI